MQQEKTRTGVFAVVGPGLLVAATGVGAGDLATGSFAGNRLGVAILWAVVLGAALKFVLNEGLARWQLATGDTLLEGCMAHLGRPFHVCFFLYLIPWSFFVGSALMSACGATAHAMLPVFDNPSHGKIVFGIAHSLLGLVLVRVGGYRLFERVMRVCIGVMFITVIVTAVLIKPNWTAVCSGLIIPRIPEFTGEGLSWTVALMGGVGGTLTVLCYGYWIREEGREGPAALRTCRIDLAAGYGMTALFGIAMVIIGSQLPAVEGKGSGLIVDLANRLEEPLGPAARWVFLLGAWGAVFSSLLGVWQSVPYIFSDFVSMALEIRLEQPVSSRRGVSLHRRARTCDLECGEKQPFAPFPAAPLGESQGQKARRVSTTSRTYQAYLLALAVIPMAGLWFGFKQVQKVYAVYGALFIPFLAVVLLYLNGRAKWIGTDHKNKPLTTALLVATLALFTLAALFEVKNKLGL